MDILAEIKCSPHLASNIEFGEGWGGMQVSLFTPGDGLDELTLVWLNKYVFIKEVHQKVSF